MIDIIIMIRGLLRAYLCSRPLPSLFLSPCENCLLTVLLGLESKSTELLKFRTFCSPSNVSQVLGSPHLVDTAGGGFVARCDHLHIGHQFMRLRLVSRRNGSREPSLVSSLSVLVSSEFRVLGVSTRNPSKKPGHTVFAYFGECFNLTPSSKEPIKNPGHWMFAYHTHVAMGQNPNRIRFNQTTK